MPPLGHDPVDKKACQGADRQGRGEPGSLLHLPARHAVRCLLQEGHNDATALGHCAAGGGYEKSKRHRLARAHSVASRRPLQAKIATALSTECPARSDALPLQKLEGV